MSSGRRWVSLTRTWVFPSALLVFSFRDSFGRDFDKRLTTKS